jgi:hypothetical protein
MGSRSRFGLELRATLCEIERGLFQATYHIRSSASNDEELPACQVGDCELDAKRRIEQSAHALGYETVIWEERHVVPPVFLRPSKVRSAMPEAALLGVG